VVCAPPKFMTLLTTRKWLKKSNTERRTTYKYFSVS
jgi:hypothetical protein